MRGPVDVSLSHALFAHLPVGPRYVTMTVMLDAFSNHSLSVEGVANPWQLVQPRVAWQDQRLTVRDDEVVQPDGRRGTFTFVETAHSVVAIVPLDLNHHVHLVRQWRYPWGRASWEIPAGYLEKAESPLQAARRELREEVGREAAHWQHLGTVYSSGLVRAPFDLFLATGLAQTTIEAALDDTEADLISLAVPFDQAIAAVMDGTIVHAVTALALLRTARALGL